MDEFTFQSIENNIRMKVERATLLSLEFWSILSEDNSSPK